MGLDTQAAGGYGGLYDSLLAVWPSKPELDLIIGVDVGVSVLFHGTICMSYSRFLSKDMPSTKEIFLLPPIKFHPVLLARKLLLLASFLQGIPLDIVLDLDRLGTKTRQIMSNVIEKVNRLVTSDDDLVTSPEGVECIMIESMYHNNAGNLRRSWVINRRAMTIAQVLGLHLHDPRPIKFLDDRSRDRIEPEHMWFRLVMSDRYLSLMLGLPQGCVESCFATERALEDCVPLERIERIETVVGGLILQRNGEDLHNLETTHNIDKLLQDAAASMPAQWWLMPDITSVAGSDINSFTETLRIMNQFTHFHLLVRLHLPYILQSSADRRYDYSKITTVTASREILSRFTHFSGAPMITSYCKGVDFLAFIASTALCLAYIDSHRQDQIGISDHTNIFQCLTHQRLSDRGLMEQTLGIMEKMAELHDDGIPSKVASILRRLLSIEAAAISDHSFRARVSPTLDHQHLHSPRIDDNILSIRIPYFGTITIEHNGILRYAEAEDGPPPVIHKVDHTRRTSRYDTLQHFQRNTSSHMGQNPQNEIPSFVTCVTGVESHDQPVIGGPQVGMSPLESLGSVEESQLTPVSKELVHMGEGYLDETYPFLSELTANPEDWTLQGVDMAFFDSLIRGSEDQATT